MSSSSSPAVLSRLRSRIRTTMDISQEVWMAAQGGAISPYHYVKPFIKRAAEVAEPPIASTPCQVVYTRGQMRLLRYVPEVRRYKTPILFVYSLINKYYILDFLPGRSLIEFMRDQGFEVYAIDWGCPGDVEQHMTWEDYFNLIGNCIGWARRLSGAPDVHLYGYCMGGTMALGYNALRPSGIRTFVAQATPVDFSEGGIFTRWTDPERFNVDALVEAYGNVPIELMESGFSMMAPIQRSTKWLEVFRKIDDKDFVTTFLAMEHWASDNIPFPGEVYRQYIKDCYQQNNFCNGRMRVGGRLIDLHNIKQPVLVIIAENDTIAPPKSSEILPTLISSEDVETLRFQAGHIGISTSSKGRKQFWPKIAAWLARRSEPMPDAKGQA